MSSAPRAEVRGAAPSTVGRDAKRDAGMIATEQVRQAPTPASASSRLPVYLVVGAVSGMAVFVASIWVRPPFQWGTLALLVGFVTLLEARGTVPMRVGRFDFQFSAKAYASIGAVYLVGLSAGLASVVAAFATNVWVKRGISAKTVFNSAMGLLVYGAAYGVFDAIRRATEGSAWLLVVAGVAGGLAAWMVNYTLLGCVLAAEQGRLRFKIRAYGRQFLTLLPYYGGYGLTGAGVLAASYRFGPVAALVTLTAPVAIVQTATNRWIREQHARVREAQSGFNATLISLSKAIDLRDKDTEGHCRRVVDYSLLMGRALKFSDEELTRLCHGALLHDIGKIGVSDTILHKPGPLTDEEWAIMRTHPELGFLMVADVKQLEKAREIILNHHERYDGRGYPNGVRGEAIPLGARLFTIADSFDAMISDRPYRKGMSIAEARAEVRRCSGTQFDPICVAAFEQISDDQLEAIAQEREHPTEEMLSF